MNNIILTHHAKQRMAQRGISLDVVHTLINYGIKIWK